MNETTGVIVDLNTLKEIRTFNMPLGFMAYANRRGVIYNTVWTGVDPATKWTAPTVFSIRLYRIGQQAVTRPTKTMLVDVTE